VITEITGIRTIRMLYLQLLYRCDFACRHCFHGERLQRADAFTVEEAITLLRLMHKQYGTEAVNLLGGEPFLHKDLPEVVRYAKQELGLHVEICTNGYRIGRRLAQIAPHLDLLRVSLDGEGATNDSIRRPGSYRAALTALDHARDLGVATGVTTTVNARNIEDVLPLARTLQDRGVGQLKLHHLRPVGNAALHPDLLITDTAVYGRLRDRLRTAGLGIEVVIDENLSEAGTGDVCDVEAGQLAVPRIEADPRGALTMSCHAVGKDAHAFWYDKRTGRILHRPSPADEITLAVPGLVYARA
jgi:MoaA/NifB/PqqE/SkfB family radical SAM enzyme